MMEGSEEYQEYQGLLLRHKRELEEFEQSFNAQIEAAKPALKKKLKLRFPKEKNAIEERQYEELLPYKLSGLLSDSTTTTTTTETSQTTSTSSSNSNNSNNSNNNNSSNKREKNKKKAEQKKKKQEELIKLARDELERDGGLSDRMKELSSIQSQLDPLALTIHEIESDGHCLYRAVCHQLSIHNDSNFSDTNSEKLTHLQLRKLVAKHLRENKNDFIFFMETEDGEMMDDEQYENYCRRVECSSEWGGQIELRAIAFILQRPIRIFQHGQPPIVMGEEFLTMRPMTTTTTISSENSDDDDNDSGSSGGEIQQQQPQDNVLMVTYHRSYYSLGEHYNSVVVKSKEEEEL